MASGTIQRGAPENITSTFKRVTYSYAWPSDFSIAANGSASIKANNFGFSKPANYSVAGIGHVNSGSANVMITGLNPEATGTGGAMTLRNLTSSAQTGKTSSIDIIYVLSEIYAGNQTIDT